MRKIIFIMLMLIALNCSDNLKQTDKISSTESIFKKSKHVDDKNSKYFTKEDSLFINTEVGYTFKFDKIKFNKIVSNHPEFFDEEIVNPDNLYYDLIVKNSW